ncbi:MAG TPA: T9SS type A sorting domain-containing protein [Chitinophagaceae bacterium]|nr:T9SS type A sorting domain-containing protein [Chitinophagaceae bacterium]
MKQKRRRFKMSGVGLTIALLLSAAVSYSQNIALVDKPDVTIYPSGNRQGSVHMAISRQNPNSMLVVADTRYNGAKYVGRYVTANGGQTWSGTDNIDPNSTGFSWGPSAAIALNGDMYMANIGKSTERYYISKSTNNGASFAGPWQAFNADGSITVGSIAVDDNPGSPFLNTFYMIYGRSYSPASNSDRVFFRKSTDGGQTFTQGNDIDIAYDGYYDIETGPGGALYMAYGYPIQFGRAVIVYRSFNGGQTFNTTLVGNYDQLDPFSTGMNSIPTYDKVALAVDKSGLSHHGRVYLVVPVKENTRAVIKMAYSDDQGVNWSNLQTVSDAAALQSWRPEVCVDQVTGNVLVAYSSIIGSNYATVTKLAVSSNGGSSFVYQTVSDVSFKTQSLYSSENYGINSIGLVAHDNKTYLTWSDNRAGEWQIRCSRVDITPAISGPNKFCTSSTYSVSAPCAGTITWDVQPSHMASLSCTNCPTTTVNKLMDGQVTLTATVTNNCGASTTTASIPIVVGNPFMAYPYPIGPDPNCLQKGGQILYGVNHSPYAYGTWMWGYVEGGSNGPVVPVDAGGLPQAGFRIPNNEDFNGVYVAVLTECGLGAQSIAVFQYSICGYNDQTWRKKNAPEGKTDVPTKLTALVSPNPAYKQVTINVPGSPNEKVTLQIFNSQGIRMTKSSVSPGIHKLDIASWPKGVYILQLQTGNQQQVVKFVKL